MFSCFFYPEKSKKRKQIRNRISKEKSKLEALVAGYNKVADQAVKLDDIEYGRFSWSADSIVEDVSGWLFSILMFYWRWLIYLVLLLKLELFKLSFVQERILSVKINLSSS